jgi:hypothetical protein
MDHLPVAGAENQEDDPFGDYPDEHVAVEAPLVVPEREQPEPAMPAEATEVTQMPKSQLATEAMAKPAAPQALVQLAAPESATEPAAEPVAPAVKTKKVQAVCATCAATPTHRSALASHGRRHLGAVS